MTAPFLLDTAEQKLVPNSVAESIWDKAIKLAILPNLTGETPIIIGENHFPSVSQKPAASIVGEGVASKGSTLKTAAKTIRPVHGQVIVEVSKDAIKSNAGRVADVVEEQLAGAIARQVDLAVFHGRDAATGESLAGAEFVNQTTNRVSLETIKNADLHLWAGYGLIVDAGHDFTGLALDPRLVFEIANARDNQGRRLNPEIDLGAFMTNYSGQPLYSSKSVSGQVDASVDTGVRGFGGDWASVKFGYAEGIEVFTQTSGNPLGNGDLEARRMVAVHANVKFGWTLMDPTALVAYENPVAAP